MSPEKKQMPMVGNFPIDQYQIESLDHETGELTFKRISQQDRYLNKAGAEIPDPRPAAPSLGKKPEMNIRDYIRTLVHNERLQADLDAAGHETFEEANDFEVGDDYFPDSKYENDLEPSIKELIREGTASLSAKARAEEARKAKLKASERANRSQGDTPPHNPEKSPRKARRALPEPSEEGDNGDLDQSETD
nr:MAG TPA: hypothetical protein [Microviridae sp.]